MNKDLEEALGKMKNIPHRPLVRRATVSIGLSLLFLAFLALLTMLWLPRYKVVTEVEKCHYNMALDEVHCIAILDNKNRVTLPFYVEVGDKIEEA